MVRLKRRFMETPRMKTAFLSSFVAFICLALPAGLLAQSGEIPEMDESKAIDEFVDKAAAESATPPDPYTRVPIGQRPLMSNQDWRNATSKFFGFSMAAEYAYWIEGKFGLGSNASYHEQVFKLNAGLECEFTFKIKDWVSAVLRGDYMYHKGSSGVINGLNAEISSFATGTFMIGAKLSVPLGEVFELKEGAWLENVDFYAKIAGGLIYMSKVTRNDPKPRQTYWEAGDIWGVNLSAGLELRLDDRFSFFFEHTFDLFSAPHASSALRPGNKANPFYFYIVQFGWIFYFD